MMIRALKVLFICFCCLMAAPAHAELYKSKVKSTKEQTESDFSLYNKKSTLKSFGEGGGDFEDGGGTDYEDGYNDAPAGEMSWYLMAGLGLLYAVSVFRKQEKKQV